MYRESQETKNKNIYRGLDNKKEDEFQIGFMCMLAGPRWVSCDWAHGSFIELALNWWQSVEIWRKCVAEWFNAALEEVSRDIMMGSHRKIMIHYYLTMVDKGYIFFLYMHVFKCVHLCCHYRAVLVGLTWNTGVVFCSEVNMRDIDSVVCLLSCLAYTAAWHFIQSLIKVCFILIWWFCEQDV